MPISRRIYDTRGQYKRAYLYTRTDTFDLTYFIRYVIRVIDESIADLRQYMDVKPKELPNMITPPESSDDLNLRQVAILELMMKDRDRPMTIKAVSGMHNVAYATARTDLLDLVDAGYLLKRKVGKEFLFFYRQSSNPNFSIYRE